MKNTSSLLLALTLCTSLASVSARADTLASSVLSEEDYSRAASEVAHFNANIDFSTCQIEKAKPSQANSNAFGFTLYTEEGNLSAEGTLICAAPEGLETASLTQSDSKGQQQQGGGGNTHVTYYKPVHQRTHYTQPRASHERCDFFSHHHIRHFHHHQHYAKSPKPHSPKQPQQQGPQQQ